MNAIPTDLQQEYDRTNNLNARYRGLGRNSVAKLIERIAALQTEVERLKEELCKKQDK